MTESTGLVAYRVEPAQPAADGLVAYLTLNDPERRNALSDALLDQLSDLLRRAAFDTEVRVIVLMSSHPRVFSSGGNLDAFADDRATIAKYAGLARFPTLYRTLTGIGKPVVCAANGDVLAGALGIAMACDLVIAKESVRLGCPEINVARRITSALGLGEVRENVYALNTGKFEWWKKFTQWVADIAGKSPLLMGMGKRALAATRDLPLDSALDYLQAQLALAFTTDDLTEGVRAFKEKRSPQWRNS